MICSKYNIPGNHLLFLYEDILEFDKVKFMKPCTDKPGLSLSVSKSSNNVKSTLDHGMLNPFKAIGIDEIKVINTPQNCSGCDHTDLQVILCLLRY